MSQAEQVQEFFSKLNEASKKAFELQTEFGEEYVADLTKYFTDLGEMTKARFEKAPALTDFSAAIEANNAFGEFVKTRSEQLVAERTEALTEIQEELKNVFAFMAPAAAEVKASSKKTAKTAKAA